MLSWGQCGPGCHGCSLYSINLAWQVGQSVPLYGLCVSFCLLWIRIFSLRAKGHLEVGPHGWTMGDLYTSWICVSVCVQLIHTYACENLARCSILFLKGDMTPQRVKVHCFRVIVGAYLDSFCVKYIGFIEKTHIENTYNSRTVCHKFQGYKGRRWNNIFLQWSNSKL